MNQTKFRSESFLHRLLRNFIYQLIRHYPIHKSWRVG